MAASTKSGAVRESKGYDAMERKDKSPSRIILGFLLGVVVHLAIIAVALYFNFSKLTRGLSFEAFEGLVAEDVPKVEEKPPEEEETESKKAGGEEGKFGEPDKTEESKLPDHDGPLVEELQNTELAKAFDSLSDNSQLQAIFQNNDLMAGVGQDFATAGEGDGMVVGRGSGGMGMSGNGKGGGGFGAGRVHGVGNLDTGGGKGTGAGLGRRGAKGPKAAITGRARVQNGFLTAEQIEKVVRRHKSAIKYCYERELVNDAKLGGRIGVQWTVGLDGKVVTASVSENTMGNRNVESCILSEVNKMRFDQPDGGMVVVAYPFTFRSAEE